MNGSIYLQPLLKFSEAHNGWNLYNENIFFCSSLSKRLNEAQCFIWSIISMLVYYLNYYDKYMDVDINPNMNMNFINNINNNFK